MQDTQLQQLAQTHNPNLYKPNQYEIFEAFNQVNGVLEQFENEMDDIVDDEEIDNMLDLMAKFNIIQQVSRRPPITIISSSSSNDNAKENSDSNQFNNNKIDKTIQSKQNQQQHQNSFLSDQHDIIQPKISKDSQSMLNESAQELFESKMNQIHNSRIGQNNEQKKQKFLPIRKIDFERNFHKQKLNGAKVFVGSGNGNSCLNNSLPAILPSQMSAKDFDTEKDRPLSGGKSIEQINEIYSSKAKKIIQKKSFGCQVDEDDLLMSHEEKLDDFLYESPVRSKSPLKQAYDRFANLVYNCVNYSAGVTNKVLSSTPWKKQKIVEKQELCVIEEDPNENNNTTFFDNNLKNNLSNKQNPNFDKSETSSPQNCCENQKIPQNNDSLFFDDINLVKEDTHKKQFGQTNPDDKNIFTSEFPENQHHYTKKCKDISFNLRNNKSMGDNINNITFDHNNGVSSSDQQQNLLNNRSNSFQPAEDFDTNNNQISFQTKNTRIANEMNDSSIKDSDKKDLNLLRNEIDKNYPDKDTNYQNIFTGSFDLCNNRQSFDSHNNLNQFLTSKNLTNGLSSIEELKEENYTDQQSQKYRNKDSILTLEKGFIADSNYGGSRFVAEPENFNNNSLENKMIEEQIEFQPFQQSFDNNKKLMDEEIVHSKFKNNVNQIEVDCNQEYADGSSYEISYDSDDDSNDDTYQWEWRTIDPQQNPFGLVDVLKQVGQVQHEISQENKQDKVKRLFCNQNRVPRWCQDQQVINAEITRAKQFKQYDQVFKKLIPERNLDLETIFPNQNPGKEKIPDIR